VGCAADDPVTGVDALDVVDMAVQPVGVGGVVDTVLEIPGVGLGVEAAGAVIVDPAIHAVDRVDVVGDGSVCVEARDTARRRVAKSLRPIGVAGLAVSPEVTSLCVPGTGVRSLPEDSCGPGYSRVCLSPAVHAGGFSAAAVGQANRPPFPCRSGRVGDEDSPDRIGRPSGRRILGVAADSARRVGIGRRGRGIHPERVGAVGGGEHSPDTPAYPVMPGIAP